MILSSPALYTAAMLLPARRLLDTERLAFRPHRSYKASHVVVLGFPYNPPCSE